eukprot:symbB.v1.2.023712.t1/scaffold2192.1/size86214/1
MALKTAGLRIGYFGHYSIYHNENQLKARKTLLDRYLLHGGQVFEIMAIDEEEDRGQPPSSGLTDAKIEDLKSSIELRLDASGAGGPPTTPSLQPPPDLSFDKKILRAYIMQPGTENFRPQKAVSPTLSRASSTHMVVRYTCHRAGVSLIVVTIYVAQHKPIDFVWHKRCAEPKVHTSKALTAPQAMTFAFLVCGGIGMVVCMVCLFCSSDQDKKELFRGPPVVHRKKGSRDIDFWQVPDSQKVGYEYEEEVIYHTGRT